MCENCNRPLHRRTAHVLYNANTDHPQPEIHRRRGLVLVDDRVPPNGAGVVPCLVHHQHVDQQQVAGARVDPTRFQA